MVYYHENMGRFKILLLGLVSFLGVAALGTLPASFAKEKDPLLYRGREYRDPTVNPLLSKPVVEEETEVVKDYVSLPPVTIQGVFWGGEAPRAIIDGAVVRKGDVLPDGIEVLDISGAGIKVLYRGKIFTILPQGVVEE